MYKNILYLIVIGALPLCAMEKIETFLQNTKGKVWSLEVQNSFDTAYGKVSLRTVLRNCKKNSSWENKEEFKNRLFERCKNERDTTSKIYQKYKRLLGYVGWEKQYFIQQEYLYDTPQSIKTVDELLHEIGPGAKILWNIVLKTKGERKEIWPVTPSTKEGMLEYLDKEVDKLLFIMHSGKESFYTINYTIKKEVYAKQLQQLLGTEVDRRRKSLLWSINRRKSRIKYFAQNIAESGRYREYPYGRMCMPYEPVIIKKFIQQYPPQEAKSTLSPELFIYQLTDEQVNKLYVQREKEIVDYKMLVQKQTEEKRNLLRSLLKEQVKKEVKTQNRLKQEEMEDFKLDVIIVGIKPVLNAFEQAQKRNATLSVDSFIDQLSQKGVCNLHAEYERRGKKFQQGGLGPITDDDF